MSKNCLDNEEISCLVEDIESMMGGTITDADKPNWCSLLRMSIQELYSNMGQFLVIEQWGSLIGKDLNRSDICLSLTRKTLDYEEQFTYAYSKQVGLQSRGHWVLKTDYIEIENGKQNYIIPKGREVNSVLWITPSDIDQALFSSFITNGYFDPSLSSGAYPANTISNQGYYIAPAYDIMLRAMDIGLKNRIRQSDLTYKITANEDGSRLLHLYSIPNKSNAIGLRWQTTSCRVWYQYYDTGELSDSEYQKCLEECKDIIKFPSQVPIEKTEYCDLNDISKTWVRKYMTALTKEVVARIRGKYKGKFIFPNAELDMEYESLLAEAKEEKANLTTEIKEWLVKLQSDQQLTRKATEAEMLNKVISYVPLGFYVI